MSDEKIIQELMRQGIEAAREGRKADAKQFFEQVVELDDKNEKAWMWLVSVAESEEERRVYLGNVLFINPNNERAQKAMEQIEAKNKQIRDQQEIVPGITRRMALLIGGGGAAIIFLLLVVFLAISGGRNAEVASQTQVALELESTSAAIAQLATQVGVDATNTQLAAVSPTPTSTNTPSRATLPPTFTPLPSPTLLVTATPLPLPINLSGKLYGWSGRDVTQNSFLNIVQFDLATGRTTAIGALEGRNPVVNPQRQTLAYTRYFAATFDFALEEYNLGSGASTLLTEGQQVLQTQMPSYCATVNQVAFVGRPSSADVSATEVTYQIFVLNLDSRQLFRLTNDRSSYAYPVYSPDCTRLAVIKSEGGANPTTDLVLIDTASLAQTPLTTDAGNFIESAARWSPDGTQLVYSAAPATDPANADIAIRRADPSSTPLLLAREPANEVFPVFSPDGRYVAFASNRSGYYDLYVLELESNTVSQLTATEDDDYPGDWTP
ncbi:MAG: PD40 domain-containing protein [Anaerolineae bacterium]|nr:PD40 domain-containing protein [Anaerolineae bacterium]